MSAQQPNSEANSIGVIIVSITFLFIVAVLAAWYLFNEEVCLIIIGMSKLTFKVITSIHQLDFYSEQIITFLFDASKADQDFIVNMNRNYARLSPLNMLLDEALVHLQFAAELFRWVVVLLSLNIMLLAIYLNKVALLKRKMNFKELLEVAKHEFPHLIAPLSFNLLDNDPDKGLGRREDSPIRFGVRIGCLKGYERNRMRMIRSHTKLKYLTFDKSTKEDQITVRDHIAKGLKNYQRSLIIDESILETEFINQLGKKFTDIDSLTNYHKALIAVFISFAQENEETKCNPFKEAAFELLEQFNRSWRYKKVVNKKGELIDFNGDFLNMAGVQLAIDNYWNTEIVQDVVVRHAYINTLMSALLQLARSKGKMWTDLFWWLKPLDRTLWWSLDQEGGDCAWSESGGVRAHLLAEIDTNLAIQTPYVATAVIGYKKFMKKEGWLYEKDDTHEVVESEAVY